MAGRLTLAAELSEQCLIWRATMRSAIGYNHPCAPAFATPDDDLALARKRHKELT
ncbi:hypothetical protein [Janthinobacterium sp. SUN211]|uniref:hypothetical protein n=1 Tax=Janthinobacterium sp. SUN211 TaxID=3014786 RepID=UPI00272EDD2A|nr:hypothetical protein [Janthinobacterium sp. SUN211]